MTLLQKHHWKATHITIIVRVIAALVLGRYLFGISPHGAHYNGSPQFPTTKLTPHSSADTAQIAPLSPAISAHAGQGAGDSSPTDPREITVGPSGISNRYRLLSLVRKTGRPEGNDLVITLHVESLAAENLVSPFASDMMEMESPSPQSIRPSIAFHRPMPGGTSLNQ